MIDAHPIIRAGTDLGHAVVTGERGIYESVVAVQEIEHGPILAHQIDEEADGLFEHGGTQRIVEGGEAFAIDAVVLFETAEIEPMARELHGEVANARTLEHSSRLRR